MEIDVALIYPIPYLVAVGRIMHIILEHNQTKKPPGFNNQNKSSSSYTRRGRANRNGGFSRFSPAKESAHNKWNSGGESASVASALEARGKRTLADRLGPIPPKKSSRVDTLFHDSLEPVHPALNHNPNLSLPSLLSQDKTAEDISSDAAKYRRHKPIEPPHADAKALVPLMSVPPPLTPAKLSEVMRLSIMEPPPVLPTTPAALQVLIVSAVLVFTYLYSRTLLSIVCLESNALLPIS